MTFRGRTVALIACGCIFFSSLITLTFMGDRSVFQLGWGALFSQPSVMTQGSPLKREQLAKIQKAYDLIKSNYLSPVNDQQLVDGAIQGMVSALRGPHSQYMDQKTASQFKESLGSSYSGIGAEVTTKNGRLTIVSPFKDSPAEKAGLRPEDQILKVNGVSIEGLEVNEAVLKTRGPKGTKAKLEVVRPGIREILHITVTRDEIPLKTVSSRRDSDGIGILTISQFSEETAGDVTKELQNLEYKGIKGLVIDVRGNPGGLLPAVLKICDELIPNHKTVMYMENKDRKRTGYQSSLKQKKKYPITVLIDEGSASAAEILAGAMNEAGGYPLVGQKTYGKGSVQLPEELGDGSNIKLTIAKWLTPNGNWIHKKGIKPTYPVQLPMYFKVVPPQGSAVLKRDTNSVEVKNLEIILDSLGYNPGRADGYFDQRTEIAVKNFQKSNGLPVSGQVNQKTSLKVRAAFLALLKNPKSDTQMQAAKELLKKQWR